MKLVALVIVVAVALVASVGLFLEYLRLLRAVYP